MLTCDSIAIRQLIPELEDAVVFACLFLLMFVDRFFS
jgi:hypothetical protein